MKQEPLKAILKKGSETKMVVDSAVASINNFNPLLTTVGFGGVAGFCLVHFKEIDENTGYSVIFSSINVSSTTRYCKCKLG